MHWRSPRGGPRLALLVLAAEFVAVGAPVGTVQSTAAAVPRTQTAPTVADSAASDSTPVTYEIAQYELQSAQTATYDPEPARRFWAALETVFRPVERVKYSKKKPDETECETGEHCDVVQLVETLMDDGKVQKIDLEIWRGDGASDQAHGSIGFREYQLFARSNIGEMSQNRAHAFVAFAKCVIAHDQGFHVTHKGGPQC